VTVLSADWVVPVESPPIRNGAVEIGADGRIASIGDAAELGEGEHFPESVILPGFVNAHTHLEYSSYAGFGDGLSFVPWIGLHIERKRRLDLADMEALASLGAYDCLRSGVTTVADASFSGAAVRACAELGLRGIVHLEVFGEDENALEGFREMRDRVTPMLSDRVELGISPHAPYTCSVELFAACAELDLPIATHLAESPAERPWIRSGSGSWQPLAEFLARPYGRDAIHALAEAGALDGRVVAAHCVHVEDEEIELLARYDVAVAHCPRSNALLGCGIAPLAALREAGLRVAIATDSPASTPSFDVFDEMRAAVMAARSREQRPDALTAPEALELATFGGARVLGREGEIGSLAVGKRADLAILSMSGSSFLPWEDPVTAVVLGGSSERVVATVIDGVRRYEKAARRCHELTDAARRARSRMLA
jgi:5-methylthioadenosine/S-adenosylhomocysteine deaminase